MRSVVWSAAALAAWAIAGGVSGEEQPNSPVKNGTGSEQHPANPDRNGNREVPVPIFQHTTKPLPEKYVIDYPVADAFCAPLDSYWEDVSQTLQMVDGNMIRHPPKGGYGLPVVDKVDGKNLLHLGCDVGFERPREPVYAVAGGVVRISSGASPTRPAENNQPPGKKPAKTRAVAARSLAGRVANGWGNLIVIEHRLPDGSYLTSVYGHLASRRLVSVGDVVTAGQVIGTVGRPGVENGGYKAHLHFAVREGRMAEPGSVLLPLRTDETSTPITLVALGEQEIEVKTEAVLPSPFVLQFADRQFAMTERDGKHYLPAAVLYCNLRPDFAIVGYGLSTKGWLDPTELLVKMRADSAPAPYGAMPKTKP